MNINCQLENGSPLTLTRIEIKDGKEVLIFNKGKRPGYQKKKPEEQKKRGRPTGWKKQKPVLITTNTNDIDLESDREDNIE